MTKPNYSLNFYKRMQNAFTQAVRFAPETVTAEMDELGTLIASFAPYVGDGSAQLGEDDLEQIKATSPNVSKVRLLSRIEGVKPLFVTNGLEMVCNMAANSINKTDDEGDLVLVAISDQCGKIADKLIFIGGETETELKVKLV